MKKRDWKCGVYDNDSHCCVWRLSLWRAPGATEFTWAEEGGEIILLMIVNGWRKEGIVSLPSRKLNLNLNLREWKSGNFSPREKKPTKIITIKGIKIQNETMKDIKKRTLFHSFEFLSSFHISFLVCFCFLFCHLRLFRFFDSRINDSNCWHSSSRIHQTTTLRCQ